MFFFSNEIAADKRYNQIIPLKISCKNLVILRCWQFRQLGRLQQKPFVTSQNRGKLINTQRFFTNLYLTFFFFTKNNCLQHVPRVQKVNTANRKVSRKKQQRVLGQGERDDSPLRLLLSLFPLIFSPRSVWATLSY